MEVLASTTSGRERQGHFQGASLHGGKLFTHRNARRESCARIGWVSDSYLPSPTIVVHDSQPFGWPDSMPKAEIS